MSVFCLDDESLKPRLSSIEKILIENEDDFLGHLREEYVRLFTRGPSNVLMASPYGSAYLGNDVGKANQMVSKITQYYEEAKFTLYKDLQEFPDHIAFELEFLGLLASRESEARGKERIKLEEIQMTFLQQFILPWIPLFCYRVVKASKFPFYHRLGDLTIGLIDFERNYLGIQE